MIYLNNLFYCKDTNVWRWRHISSGTDKTSTERARILSARPSISTVRTSSSKDTSDGSCRLFGWRGIFGQALLYSNRILAYFVGYAAAFWIQWKGPTTFGWFVTESRKSKIKRINQLILFNSSDLRLASYSYFVTLSKLTLQLFNTPQQRLTFPFQERIVRTITKTNSEYILSLLHSY